MGKLQTSILRLYTILVCFVLAAGPINAAEAPDAANAERLRAITHVGKVLFQRRCAKCHTAEEPVHNIGPSLYQIVGRPAASAPGYNYSATLRTSGLVWSEDNLARYINDPNAYIPCRTIRIGALSMCPGIHMEFRGFRNKYAAQAVVTYLKAAGQSQP
jgi:cytochrome c